MRWTLAILFLSSLCTAQVQGNLPNASDCQQDRIIGNTPGVLIWQEPIAIGDTIVLGITAEAGGTFTLADSLGNTWTQTASTTTPVQTQSKVWMAYTQSAFAGADTVTLTFVSGTTPTYYYIMGCRFTGLGAVDGAVVTATSTASGVSTISTSNTTTANNDILVSTVGSADFGNGTLSPSDTEAPDSQGTASPAIRQLMTYKHAGAAGVNTATENTWASGTTYAMQTLAFKPSSIRIADTILPDVGSGVDPKIQLHCVGGIAGQTYSHPTGTFPTGLSLNTATGLISGTTTATGTTSQGFACTDGTTTSATATLSMTVGGTLKVPTIRQSLTFQADNGANFNMNLQCGSTLVIVTRGDDTHGGQGWMQAVNGASNYVKDSFASPVRRIDSFIPGNPAWPLVTTIIGPLTQSGVDTILITNNQNASSGRANNFIMEITGGNVWDAGSGVNSATSSATGSFATSYTSVVGNTLLLLASDTDTDFATLSPSAPFSTISTGGDVQGTSLYATAMIASPTATTATTSFTGGSATASFWGSVIIPIRPSLAVAGCPSNFGTGEKIRRQVY